MTSRVPATSNVFYCKKPLLCCATVTEKCSEHLQKPWNKLIGQCKRYITCPNYLGRITSYCHISFPHDKSVLVTIKPLRTWDIRFIIEMGYLINLKVYFHLLCKSQVWIYVHKKINLVGKLGPLMSRAITLSNVPQIGTVNDVLSSLMIDICKELAELRVYEHWRP